MGALSMEWVWADGPNPHNGSITISVRTQGAPGYRYYNRTTSTGWTLIAVANTEAESIDWYVHTVTREPAPANVAVWLDGVAADLPGGAR